MECCESRTTFATSRRSLLLGGAAFAAWAYLPKFARGADGGDPRLIVVILRGALDGLATVAPLGDPDYAELHGAIALTPDGPHAAVVLDSLFALHPSMPEFARMYRAKQAAIVHAVATPYRDRSHFDGQDVLESGFAGPGRVQSGWLNRAIEALPRGERVMNGLAVGPTTPLVLRGAAPTVGWTPAALPQAADDTAMRLLELYGHRDPALASALSQGLQLEKAALGDDMKPKPGANNAGAMRLVARGAAKLMAADDGPRIAALAFDGWTPMPMKVARSDGWRSCCRVSTVRCRNSKAALASAGAIPWWWSPPSSAAPRGSTAPKAPIMAPAPSRCWRAAR